MIGLTGREVLAHLQPALTTTDMGVSKMANRRIGFHYASHNNQSPDRIWLTTTESGKVDDWTQWLDDQDQLHPKAPRTEYIRADRFSYQIDAANARTEYWKAKYDAAVADRDAANARADQSDESLQKLNRILDMRRAMHRSDATLQRTSDIRKRIAGTYPDEAEAIANLEEVYTDAAAILALRDKPAPAVTVQGVSSNPLMQAQFADWFRRNYPGPDTIIVNPDWHAPRILNAAIWFINNPPPPSEA